MLWRTSGLQSLSNYRCETTENMEGTRVVLPRATREDKTSSPTQAVHKLPPPSAFGGTTLPTIRLTVVPPLRTTFDTPCRPIETRLLPFLLPEMDDTGKAKRGLTTSDAPPTHPLPELWGFRPFEKKQLIHMAETHPKNAANDMTPTEHTHTDNVQKTKALFQVSNTRLGPRNFDVITYFLQAGTNTRPLFLLGVLKLEAATNLGYFRDPTSSFQCCFCSTAASYASGEP